MTNGMTATSVRSAPRPAGPPLARALLGLLAIGIVGAASASVAPAQDQASVGPWTYSDLTVKRTPTGRFAKHGGRFFWVSSAGVPHEYEGAVQFVGAVAEVGEGRYALLGLREPGVGGVDIIRLEPDSEPVFRVLRSLPSSIQPIAGAFDPVDRDLWVRDEPSGEIQVSRFPAGNGLPDALTWEPTRHVFRTPMMLIPNDTGGVLIRARGVGQIGRRSRSGFAFDPWSAELAKKAPGLRCMSDRVVEVSFPVGASPAVAWLEAESGAPSIPLGRVRKSRQTFELKEPLSLHTRYRPVIRETAIVRGRWQTPRATVGQPTEFGGASFRRFRVGSAGAYLGSSRFGFSLTHGNQTTGLAHSVGWIRAATSRTPPTVDRGGVSFLKPSHTVFMPLRTERAEARRLTRFLFGIPNDSALLGGVVWAQTAVVGPGPEDLVVSPIVGVGIARENRLPERAAHPNLRAAQLEFWRRYGTTSPNPVRAVAEHASRLATR